MKSLLKLAPALVLGSSLLGSFAAQAKTGEEVYKATCGTCHNTGVSNAPKLGDAAAWKERLEARDEATLVKHSISGFNAMPAKGLCMACTDQELTDAVKYMLENSK